MTDSETFEGRADGAAAKLKAQMGLPEKQVVANPQKQPPPGSYLAQQRQAQMRRAEDVQAQEVRQETPPQEQPPQQNGEEAQLPQSVQARFSELTQKIHALEAEKNDVNSRVTQAEQLAQQREQELQALREQHEAYLAQHLDNLPEDERARVLARSQMLEVGQQIRQDLMSQIAPQLNALQEQEQLRQLHQVADKFPGFDYDTHAPLIRAFRDRNPASTVEMAFKAIAEPHELGIAPQRQPQAVPQVVQPRGSSPIKQAPEPEQDPNAQLQEEAAKLRELARTASTPEERRELERMQQEHIGRRLFGSQ